MERKAKEERDKPEFAVDEKMQVKPKKDFKIERLVNEYDSVKWELPDAERILPDAKMIRPDAKTILPQLTPQRQPKIEQKPVSSSKSTSSVSRNKDYLDASFTTTTTPTTASTTTTTTASTTTTAVSHARSQDGAARFRFRISDGERSLASDCEDDDDDDNDEDDDDVETTAKKQDLWTHVYIPDRAPAPYAESLVDDEEDDPLKGFDFVEIKPVCINFHIVVMQTVSISDVCVH